MSTRAVVLLSGGLDSVYNLYRAQKEWGDGVVAVNFNYGQKAFEAEKRASQYFCKALNIEMQTIDIANVFSGDSSALTGGGEAIPTSEVDIESQEASIKSAEKVWVANRNGVFLNVAACVAEKQGALWIVPGFNAEEAATFPDNSVDYIEKMNACLQLSTSNRVQIRCFSQSMNKEQIVKDLVTLGGEVDHIWSCYFNGESPCGECESCKRLARAKKALF